MNLSNDKVWLTFVLGRPKSTWFIWQQWQHYAHRWQVFDWKHSQFSLLFSDKFYFYWKCTTFCFFYENIEQWFRIKMTTVRIFHKFPTFSSYCAKIELKSWRKVVYQDANSKLVSAALPIPMAMLSSAMDKRVEVDTRPMFIIFAQNRVRIFFGFKIVWFSVQLYG